MSHFFNKYPELCGQKWKLVPVRMAHRSEVAATRRGVST